MIGTIRASLNRIGAVAGALALTVSLAGWAGTPATTGHTSASAVDPEGAGLTPITSGHIHALDVDSDGLGLTLNLRDDRDLTRINDDVDPARVELHVLPAAQTTVRSGSQWSFLGPAGAPVWVLPATQRDDLLWPGLDTNDIPGGALQSSVSIRLLDVTGPGRFAAYAVGPLGTPAVLYNSADGLPDAVDQPRAVHRHVNWAFGAAGAYDLTFEATATVASGAVRSSGPVTYRFVVGS